MKFPCQVEVMLNYNNFLPPGTYNAVGRQGDFIILEYHLGWRYVYNMPEFCKADCRYTSVNIHNITAKGKNRNGRDIKTKQNTSKRKGA